MCRSTHVTDAFSSSYGRDRRIDTQPCPSACLPALLLHESDKTYCTVPTLTGRQGSVLSGRCVAASSDQTRRTREQEENRASVGQTRFLSKPREIRLRAPAVFFLPRTSVGHSFNASSFARGQGGGDGNRRFVIGMGRQSSRIIGQRPLVQGSEVTPHKLPGTDGRREFASAISGQGGREDCVRPDRQQNCSGLPGEGRGHKVGTSVPPGLPNPVVVPTASDNPDPCVREGDQQHLDTAICPT